LFFDYVTTVTEVWRARKRIVMEGSRSGREYPYGVCTRR